MDVCVDFGGDDEENYVVFCNFVGVRSHIGRITIA